MRGRGWARDIISHFLIVSLLGVGLLLLHKKAMNTPELKDESWISTVFTIAFILDSDGYRFYWTGLYALDWNVALGTLKAWLALTVCVAFICLNVPKTTRDMA